MSTTELHRADPRLRRLAPWVLATVAVAGSGGLWWLQAFLAGASLDQDRLMRAAITLVVLLAAGALALALVLLQQSVRVRREECFPPASMRTLRDVPVVRGAAAKRCAAWLRSGAVAAIAVAVGILVFGARLLSLG